jgi:hypothetical protein
MRDADAYQRARALFGGLSEAELQFLLSVARFETSFGDGWKPGEGAGSNNTGAVQERDPSKPHFEHVDHHGDGSRYVARFKVYPSWEAGMLDQALVLLKPNVRRALATGDASGAVAAQRANGYFEAPLQAYEAAIKRHHEALTNGAHLRSALHFGIAGGITLIAAALLWAVLNMRRN